MWIRYLTGCARLLQEWLQHEGSPASQIQRCEFGQEKELPSAAYKSFEVRR